MKIGDEVYIHGYIDEIRKDVVIIRNDGGYFGTTAEEISESSVKAEDAISRQAVLHIPLNLRNDDIINSLPPVNPQPKTGHWIEEDMFDGDVAYRCSECNELFWIESGTPTDNEYNYCPKCGKRLVDPQENEDKE